MIDQLQAPAKAAQRGGGFTLIELLIYSMLSIVVLLIVGGIFINSLKAERAVRAASEGASAGQLVAQSLTNGIRNASSAQVSSPSVDTRLLMTRSVGSDTTPVWTCRAWYFGDGEIRTTTSTSAIPVPTVPADAAGWMLLAEGVTADTSATPSPVFDFPSGDTAFTNRQVDFVFNVSTGNGPSVLISSSAVSRQSPPPPTGESPTCFVP